MTSRRAASRRPSLSARIASGFVFYVVISAVIVVLDLQTVVAALLDIPVWASGFLPPVIYAGLATLWLARRAPRHVATALAIMAAAHVVLVAATAGAQSLLDGSSFGAAVVEGIWAAPLLTLVQVLVVAWMFQPLGRRLAPALRASRMARPVARVAPVERPGTGGAPPAALAPVAPEVVPAGAPPQSDAWGAGAADPAQPGPEREVPARPAETAMRPRGADGPARTPSADTVEEVIRVRFDRVAEQLPAAAFLLPLERVGANLLEPDHLLVPQRLVAPQLVEGLVRISWDVVADQFPRQALALPDAEIARRLANGVLLLPLDEIIRQLPSRLFALESPTVDVRGIEDYPLPFQPHVPQPAEESASPAPAMPPPPAPPRTEDPAPERRPPAPVEAAPPAPAREVSPPVREERSVEPPPAPPSRPSPPPVESRRPLTEGDDAVRVRPAEPAGMVEPPPSRPAQETVPPYRSRPAEAPESYRARPADIVERRRPERRRHVELAAVTAQLAPLVGPLEIGQRYQAGVTLVTAAASSVDPEAATATAVPYIPFLADPRLPQPVSQATVRAGSGSLVLTPLGPLERGGTVLLTAVPPGAPLAMVERASLRAVDDQDAPDEAPPAVRSADGAGDPDLRMASVPPHVRAVADSLRAFGQVTPAVLRDHAGTLLMYLFLSPDVDARLIAGFARDLRRNFTGAPLGAVSSVIARVGVHRVVVWELDAGRSCASVLVACGPVDRPGLARIELERAALRLAAL